MCPAYAKKAGNECKKWAKFVPARVDEVHIRTAMGVSVHFAQRASDRRRTSSCAKMDNSCA
jgi:hypothetical protein